jgi:D-amino-acid oxidase
MDILVVGCGVSGLTTALLLREAGHDVSIWARALPPDTTSNVAAAVWYPYRAYPVAKVSRWGAEAYAAFERLAAGGASGVLLADVLELLPKPSPDPWWVDAVKGFRRARPDELPTGYADGYAFAAPVIDTTVYLDYLRRAFETAGGRIERRAVADFAEAFAVCPIVVNCAGLGAGGLAGDTDLHAARGQVVRIAHNGFRRVLLDDAGPNSVAYIVPRINDIILGGVDDDHDERLTIDETQTLSILRRCANLVAHFDPDFAASLRALLDPEGVKAPAAEVLGVSCGLRPVRSAVRVEAERIAPDRLLLHNYGHGGAGVTLSWGCAAEVVALLHAVAPPSVA